MLENKSRGRISKKPSLEILSIAYRSKTAKQIANDYGVSESTVKRWIATYRKELKNNI